MELHKNLAKARGDVWRRRGGPATLRLRGDRGDVLHRHLAILIDEPARAPFGNYIGPSCIPDPGEPFVGILDFSKKPTLGNVTPRMENSKETVY